MGFYIEDGKGSGRAASVDKENRLAVQAISQEDLEHASEEGNAYIMTNVTYNYDTADTIMLIKNTSTDSVFHIYDVYFAGDTATLVQFHIPTSEVATPAGTTITPTNLNTASGKTASLNVKGDETANSQGTLIHSAFLTTASTTYHIDFEGILILATSESLGIDYVTDGGAAYVTVIGHFEDTA